MHFPLKLSNGPLWWAIFLAALAPALYYWGLFIFDPRTLGVDSLEVVLQGMGRWTLWMLLLTLLLSPLKRHTPFKTAVRYRRMLGLFTFFYATVHLSTYFIGWIELDWQEFVEDIAKRPFIYLGMIAWTGLLALAVTSPKPMVRRLKRNWKRLHRILYVIIVLALIHFWLQVRAVSFEAWLYTLIVILLLGERLLEKARSWKRGRGRRHQQRTA